MSEFRPEFHLLRVEEVIAGAEFAPSLESRSQPQLRSERNTGARSISTEGGERFPSRLAGRFACNAAGAQFTCRKGI